MLDLVTIARGGIRGLIVGTIVGISYGAMVTGGYGVWMDSWRPQLLPHGAALPMTLLGVLWGTPCGAVLGLVVGAVLGSLQRWNAWLGTLVGVSVGMSAWFGLFQGDTVTVLVDAPLLASVWLGFSALVGGVVSQIQPVALTATTLGLRDRGPAPN